MNLGIAGRKAIVCASSRGLGKACARALAEAGCEVVINGRDAKKLEATAAELASVAGVKVIPVVADVATAEGQAALFAACPSPDILVNNNAGPPPRDFRELTRQQMIDGVVANMVVAIELIQKVIGPMSERILNAFFQQGGNFADGFVSQIAADGVSSQWQRQPRILHPPLTQVNNQMQSIVLVGELSFVDDQAGVDLAFLGYSQNFVKRVKDRREVVSQGLIERSHRRDRFAHHEPCGQRY